MLNFQNFSISLEEKLKQQKLKLAQKTIQMIDLRLIIPFNQIVKKNNSVYFNFVLDLKLQELILQIAS